ncbi:hypothetical protein [Bosea sp. (in: a-proteobacteria)]|uniref:hypothetical protein n=1 Tax=Bosea sp. (in: a-proteobacteria) TaxID=1871050 RepID=UPI002FC7A403
MIEPWLVVLGLKMAIAAGIVVGCSVIAERSGPFLAAMIATLPISAGPVYVFLALEHDAAFIAGSALAGMATNLANGGFLLAYVPLAQRFGLAVSLGAALLAWSAIILLFRAGQPSFLLLLALTPPAFLLLHRLFRPYLEARPAVPPKRLWFAIPLRAAAIATVAGVASTVSARVGPAWSGVMAGVPIVLSSLIVILQPRIGGPASAAVIANAAIGFLGFGSALAVVHLAAPPLGSWPALALGLAVSIGWNLVLMDLARRRSAP